MCSVHTIAYQLHKWLEMNLMAQDSFDQFWRMWILVLEFIALDHPAHCIVYFLMMMFCCWTAAGAGLTGIKMARRTSGVDEFQFEVLGENHQQGVCVSLSLSSSFCVVFQFSETDLTSIEFFSSSCSWLKPTLSKWGVGLDHKAITNQLLWVLLLLLYLWRTQDQSIVERAGQAKSYVQSLVLHVAKSYGEKQWYQAFKI
jgi:hypothetical protein